MTTRYHFLLASGLLALLPAHAGAQGRAVELPVASPDVQAEVRAAMHAAVDVERRAALDTLAARHVADPGALTAQLFLYSASATSTRDGMALAVLARALDLEDRTLVSTVVPFLEAEDEALRREAAGVLAEFEDADAERPPTFAIYRPSLEAAKREGVEPPHGLVRHLFETDPGTAVRLLMRVLERDVVEQRAILWAEHVVAGEVWKRRYGFASGDDLPLEVVRQLDAVTRHPEWWVRAYAASVRTRHAFLADEQALELLRRDAHPLVRRLAR